MIAIAIAGALLSTFALVAVAGVRGSVSARDAQQAGDIIDSALESARVQTYDNLTMLTTDATAASDSRITSSGCPTTTTPCVAVPNPNGSGTVEQSLVTSSAPGYITQHIKTVNTNSNKVSFKVATYITQPTDEENASYKRITVYVDWTTQGKKHEQVGSTYVTDTKRGLPLPHFQLKAGTLQNSGPTTGYTAVLEFTINNLGARDAFSLTTSSAGYGWTFWADDDPSGTWSSSNTELDTSKPVTPLIEPNATYTFFAVETIPSGTAVSSTNTTFTATSVAQPSLGAGVSSESQTESVSVVQFSTPTPTTTVTPSATATATSASCSTVGTIPTSGTEYYLHNTTDGTDYTTAASTTSLYPMMFSTNVPSATVTQDFSSDDGYASFAGRNLTAGAASFSSTNPKVVADWDLQITNAPKKSGYTFSGTTYLTVWAEPASGLSTDSVNLQAMVGYGTTVGNGHNAAFAYSNETSTTATATGSGCGTWREFVIGIPTSTFNAATGDWIEVLLFDSGSKDVRIGYDTTSFMGNVVWNRA